MINDLDLSASIASDAFHAAEDSGHDLDTLEAVSDLLAQVFPSAEREPSGLWAIKARCVPGATFKPGSLRPAAVR